MMRSIVTFDAPIDEGPPDQHVPGRPLAERIGRGLVERGIQAQHLDLHGNYAWSWLSDVEGTTLYTTLGFRDDASGRWLLSFMPRFKLAARLFSPSRYREATTRLARALDDALSADAAVSNIRWHLEEQFNRGNEAAWERHP